MSVPGPTGPEIPPDRLWNKFRKGLVLFLEIIGILPPPPPDQTELLARFRLLHTEFRKLLSANNSFLETLAEIEKQRYSGGPADQELIKRKAIRAAADIHAMITSLQAISNGRFSSLPEAFDRIAAELTSRMETGLDKPGDLVLDLTGIKASLADLVGGKMANLAELANTLHLPTPDGFAITTEAYRVFIRDGGLQSWLQSCLLEMASSPDPREWADEIVTEFKQTSLPTPLETAIREAYDRWRERVGPGITLAVRSSAVGEDSRLSFAGQFLTLLNVNREKLPGAYQEILASLYSQEAVHYRSLHGVANEGAEMAAAVISQIEALASGVMFSVDPSQPDDDKVVIQAVRGLGVSLVDGRVSPETVSVVFHDHDIQLERIPSGQDTKIICSTDSGLVEEAIDPAEAQVPILTSEEARQLAVWAKKIETHFGGPQDIEWAMDQDRKLYLLQSRPLKLARGATRRVPPMDGYTLLVSGGEVACPGVGCGPAIYLSEDDDPESFPKGAVLVARRPSPKFIRIMDKAKAIVTDAGSTTGHMASLARELRVPTLLNTKIATQAIPIGAIVTVDPLNGYVYAGEVKELLARDEEIAEDTSSSPLPPEEKPWSNILELVVPLHLTDPRSPDFNPGQALTLHDLARYVHEKSYEVMFGLGEKMGDMRPSSFLLDVFLPIDLYLIDLGGGLTEPPKGRKVKRTQITSVPMAAILEGMLDKRIPRFGPKPIDTRGLLSIMMRHATENPEQEQTFKDPSYALISSHYLNLTARVGYHFSVVDAYCGVTPNKNYISLLFRGGAANEIQRHRRVRAIGAVLANHGFTTKIERDSIYARLSKAPQEEITQHLTMIGRLFQFFRQMDAAMTNEAAVKRVSEAFLNGQFDFFSPTKQSYGDNPVREEKSAR